MAEYGYVGTSRDGSNVYECLEDGDIVKQVDLAKHDWEVHGVAPVPEPEPVDPTEGGGHESTETGGSEPVLPGDEEPTVEDDVTEEDDDAWTA